jgi:FKBP-type peptidyl-prolyl cis-trans isomerase SlyD
MGELTADKDRVVTFHFTLKADDGEILDSTDGGEPYPILVGAGNFLPKVEEALMGKVAGDKISVVVPPEEGYGTLDNESEDDYFGVPLAEFPDDMDLIPGMPLVLETEEGEEEEVWVVDVDDEEGVVVLSPNHPLAGETLHFDIAIVAVRAATAEEIEHGHPHGAADDHNMAERIGELTADKDRVVTFHFTLKADDGEILDSTDGGEPYPILVGAGNFLPKVEEALMGKVAGDKISVVVPPEEGVVVLSPNHPLAGETLHLDIAIVAVRAATAEEIEHGHPHGAADYNMSEMN